MRKFRQLIISFIVLVVLLGASALAGWLAEKNLWVYFSKEAVFKDWIKWNYIFYWAVAAVEFLTTAVMMFWGRSGITAWEKRKRKFPQAVASVMVINAFVVALASYLLAFFHKVTTGDVIYLSHGLYLATTLVALLIMLLLIFIIKPTSRALDY